MDLAEITRLVKAIEATTKMKFNWEKSHSEYHRVSIASADYLPLEIAQGLAAELNAATEPIIQKFERNLRKELARCGK